MEDLRSTTRVAAAAPAVGLKRPATAVKSVENRGTLAKGVATSANRSSASASVPNACSPTANVVVTAETTLARAVQRADSLSATAARPASNLSLAVYAVQSAISHSV